jgi:type IV pilus assembly protein PilC
MPKFKCDLKNTQGISVKQTIIAESIKEARDKMRGQGFSIVEIKEVADGFSLEKLTMSIKKVTVKDKAIFSRQLATLVNAGVSIVRGLGVLTDQCENPKLKLALKEILADVQQGANLSDAMRKQPESFDKLYCAMVEAGEAGGVLDDVLQRLAKLLEDSAKLNNQIKSAMTYPVTVSILAVLIFVGMCVFILPTFEGVFKQLGGELPVFTQILVNISNFLRSPQVIIIPIAIFIFGAVYSYIYSTPPGKLYLDGVGLKLPLFGDLLRKTAVARFSRTFGSLSRAGVPILGALEITGETAGNQVLTNALTNARQVVREGGQIAPAIEKENIFPVMAIQMITIGEETGELDKMLMKVADFYENEVEEAVKALTSIMEPIMIVVLGGMVGSILVGMYLPIFSIMDQIK